ncbi:cytochrome P450 [Kaistella sp. 97-N-M2]|uniref:cytochrome P450 n=1 Tax=Kaistella sp. 97-N-M2 TaxID=2908645 RepID=UPI001F27FB8D|nr:cytochrome P450 [Kaistella sp. 97-N-M2]UJF28944.1 cytochrome P450 [Kaistella sp. 97-N-M2]
MYNYPPKVSEKNIWKTLLKLNSNPIAIISKNFQDLGETYTLNSFLVKKRFVFSRDPDLFDYVLRKNQKNYEKSAIQTHVLGKYLGKGLLTNTGKSWLKQRRLVQPNFSTKNIELLRQTMIDEINAILESQLKDETIDLYRMTNSLTFNIIAKTLFGNSIDYTQILRISDSITEIQKMFIKEVRKPFLMSWYKISGQLKKHLQLSEEMRAVFREIILKRQNETGEFNDILQNLLNSRYEDSSEPMAMEQLIDEIIILFVAGHETSANALAFTLFLIENDEHEKHLLIKEIDNLGEDFLALKTLFGNSKTMTIIKESLRLYPPAWIIDRVALEDDSFKDFSWEKGTIVEFLMYDMHRNSAYWEQPDSFLPERFLEEDIKNKPYFPFGNGARYCIGEHFAYMEMILFLRLFYKKYDLELETKEMKTIALITLRPVELRGKIITNLHH